MSNRLVEIPEQAEQAQFILRTALNRLRAMGYAVETTDDEGRVVWIHELRPAWRGKVLEPLGESDAGRTEGE